MSSEKEILFDREQRSTPFVYIWIIRDFQELYKDKRFCKGIYSDKFSSTVPQPYRDENNENDKNDSKLEHSWRILLLPHGVFEVNDHVSLFLAPYQTEYEKQNGSLYRRISFSFHLYKIKNNDSNVEEYEQLNYCCFNQTFMDFEIKSGSDEFCKTSMIFPNDDFNQKIDLLIKFSLWDKQREFIENSLNSLETYAFSPSLEDYFNKEAFSDITFTFDCGNQVKSSRITLASRSPYFNKMFQGDWVESKSTQIPIKNVSYHCFKAILFYIYTGKLEEGLSFEILKDLYCEADMRELYGLKRLVTLKLKNCLNINNWDMVLIIGWQTKNDSLKNRALQFIHENWSQVKESGKVQQIMEYGNVDLLEEFMAARFFGVR